MKDNDDWGGVGALPGNPMMWVLIGSELLVFGAGLIGLAGARLMQPELFAASQASLDRLTGTINTGVLLTSGFFAALAVAAIRQGRVQRARAWLAGAGALGLAFLVIKIFEYAEKAQAGIGLDTNDFFTLYYLLTGFHLAHVVFGLIILVVVGLSARLETIETGTAFWHMVDLVWVLIFPMIYLVR